MTRIERITTELHLQRLERLNDKALDEEIGFKMLPTQKSHIELQKRIGNYIELRGYLTISNTNRALGYLVFCQEPDVYEGIPVLQQLYVKPKHRRKGIATQLIQTLLQNDATKPNSKGCYFILESPNFVSLKLFEKLGFVKENEEEIQLIKCAWAGTIHPDFIEEYSKDKRRLAKTEKPSPTNE